MQKRYRIYSRKYEKSNCLRIDRFFVKCIKINVKLGTTTVGKKNKF